MFPLKQMGCIMSKCIRCGVEILDDSHICPLCNGVVENEKEEYESKSVMYPDAVQVMKRLRLFTKIFIFISVIVECVLVLINYLTYKGVKWSFICGLALGYACFTVIYTLKRDKSHRRKMWIQSLSAMILMYVLDFATGYRGWSVAFAIPVIILAMDGMILIIMIINHRHWQNYLLLQVMMAVISVIFSGLAAFDLINPPILNFIATGVSGIFLLGTILFGDRKAMTELSRRFKI